MNSRHPSPRREKWGWERRLVFHFGEIRGLPGLAGACRGLPRLNSGKPPDAVKTNDFDNFPGKCRHFLRKIGKGAPRTPRRPQGVPHASQTGPEGIQGKPRAPKREPKRAHGGSQEAKGTPKDPPEPKIYEKTPDQPPITAAC